MNLMRFLLRSSRSIVILSAIAGAAGGSKSSTRRKTSARGAPCAAPAASKRARVSASRNKSDVMASIAVRRLGASRNTSLNISSDSGPL